MTLYEKFALWEYLTDFEDSMEFKDVLKEVRRNGYSITIAEPYADFDGNDLSDMIRQTAIEAAMWFAPKDFRSVFKKEKAI